ncbi:hypothetical protein Goklo_018546 [Gossypium klotzschianum]|uniref:Uncharacterized protein n=1 Tax=Gossypium klotzschianum TaxID=34286 RepID=A0A7J8UL03_9ROSI|nr:hypothetical protein [Gossypium klotzschianum]
MLVTNIGELSYFKKKMAKDNYVDTKVEDLQILKSITTPLSKKSLQSKEVFLHFNSIYMDIISLLKWTCLPSPRC